MGPPFFEAFCLAVYMLTIPLSGPSITYAFAWKSWCSNFHLTMINLVFSNMCNQTDKYLIIDELTWSPKMVSWYNKLPRSGVKQVIQDLLVFLFFLELHYYSSQTALSILCQAPFSVQTLFFWSEFLLSCPLKFQASSWNHLMSQQLQHLSHPYLNKE